MMASLPPSQLYAYHNKGALDDLLLNACDSSGVLRKPRIPPELMYEPFQAFVRDIAQPLESSDDPRFQMEHNAPRDIENFFQGVIDLMKIAAARYFTEDALSRELNQKFSDLLGVATVRQLTPRAPGDREGVADGAYEATGFGSPAFILIRADKLGSGTGGGDSLVELLGHYANVLLFMPSSPPSPTVFVEVVGPRLIISLAACDHVSRPAVSPAVVWHSLLWQANPTGQISSLAATLLALRRLVTAMTLEKDNFPKPLVSDDTRLGFNLVFRRPDGSYHKYLRGSDNYGSEAHAWCSAQGHAPIFNVVDICPTWRRIEMRNIEGNAGQWSIVHGIGDAATQEAILVAVRDVVKAMHFAGFVHGDVRAANTLYRRENDVVRVMLIDFDSAGRAGVARYSILPFAIEYAPGALPGGLVMIEHDLWRLETASRFFV